MNARAGVFATIDPYSDAARLEVRTPTAGDPAAASRVATSKPSRSGLSVGVRRRLPAGALAVLAPWPAAGPPLALLQLLLGAPDAALPGRLLLSVLHPADELVAGQGRDVLPRLECRGVGHQRFTQVGGQLVHYPTRQSLTA